MKSFRVCFVSPFVSKLLRDTYPSSAFIQAKGPKNLGKNILSPKPRVSPAPEVGQLLTLCDMRWRKLVLFCPDEMWLRFLGASLSEDFHDSAWL